jgi:membrane associated rhomboid family serine protease
MRAFILLLFYFLFHFFFFIPSENDRAALALCGLYVGYALHLWIERRANEAWLPSSMSVGLGTSDRLD